MAENLKKMIKMIYAWCRLASFPILHAMFFSLPLLLLTKMPIPQGVDETHLEAMSTEYEYYDYEGIPIQVLHTIQKG